MAKTEGIGPRVASRLKALGYWKNGKPEVYRFADERGFQGSYVYRWLHGETPRGAVLFKLADALEVEARWLVPAPSYRRARKILTCLVAALSLGASTADCVRASYRDATDSAIGSADTSYRHLFSYLRSACQVFTGLWRPAFV